MTIMRRKRLPDGSFGELEKVFDGETDSEKIERLERENAFLSFSLVEKDMKIESVEQLHAGLVFQLIEKGVL